MTDPVIASFDIGEKNFAYVIGTKNTVIVMRHVDVVTKKRQTVIESCKEVSKVLESEDFSACDRVVIEQQMSRNVRAQRIAQHVWTWFSVRFPNIGAEFVSARIKTDRNLSYRDRKRAAVDTVRKLLTERGDIEHLTYMNSLPKQDDVADACVQVLRV